MNVRTSRKVQTEADGQRVREAGALLEPHLPRLLDDFYAELQRHTETRAVLARSQVSVAHLQGTLRTWLRELLSGPYDSAYVAQRWQVGKRHVEVGLEQVYVSTALARLRAGLAEIMLQHWPGERDGLVPAILSLNKLLDLDLTIIESAYQTEYLERLRRDELLAKIGHVAGSVGHELRSPLNVLKTSAYYLAHASVPDPQKVAQHLERIERHMSVAEQVLQELSDFARMPAPRPRLFRVGACVEEALGQVLLVKDIRDIRLTKDFPASLPPALGDEGQIRVLFVRLFRRAQDGMRNGGHLSIRGQIADDAVEVAFQDTGPSLAPKIVAALPAPLPWASVRVLGMGLAMAKAILEVNNGSLYAASVGGQGCLLTVRLAVPPSAVPQAGAG